MEVELERIYPNPDQPRKHFPKAPLEDLARSIKEQGLIEPLVVVRRGNKYMLIAGERRWRAGKIAGLKTAPVRVLDTTEAAIAEMALVENIQRQDLTPLEEARAFKAMLESGYTKEALAKKLGFKQVWRIDERLTLLDLSPKLQEALTFGIISPLQAYYTSFLKDYGDQELVFQKIKNGELPTANHLRRFITAMIEVKKQPAFFPKPKKAELEIVNRWEKALAAVADLVTRSFSKKDCRVLARVWQGNVQKDIQQIDLIINTLNLVKKAMLENASRQEATQIQNGLGGAQ